MIETFIKEYLEKIIDAPVLIEAPEIPSEKFSKIPERYVLIDRLGYSTENMIERHRIALQSYGPSLFEAAKLDKKVRATMEKIILLNNVGACEITGSYNFTDTVKKKYRYQSTFEIINRKGDI